MKKVDVKTNKQVIFISGATSGIGTYLAHYFANRNYYLVLHARNKSKLAKLLKELPGDSTLGVVADLQSSKNIEQMFAEVKSKVRAIDVLINNAFGKLEIELKDAKGTDIENFFLASVAGTANVTRCALPFMRKSKSPCVINIVADWGFPMHNIMTGPSLYISAKYAIHGLGAALQTEILKYGIRTTNICPGVIDSQAKFEAGKAEYSGSESDKAIHPIDIAKSIDYVIGQSNSHIRSIVLSPRNAEYNGL